MRQTKENMLSAIGSNDNVVEAIETKTEMYMLIRVLDRNIRKMDSGFGCRLPTLSVDELRDLGLSSDEEPLSVLLAYYKEYLNKKR